VPALRRVWCCGCCRRTARGVAGAVVGLRGVVVAVAVIAPRVDCGRRLCTACGVAVAVVAPRVGRSRRLCAVWVSRSRSSWWLSSCRVVLQPRSSSSHRHWTTKEEVSRKKKKENVPAGRRGAVRAAAKGQTRGPHLHIPQNYLITFYLFTRFWYMNVLKDRLERPTLAYKFHDH
jgi:hypothetical protein